MSQEQPHLPLWRIHGLMVLAAILVSTSFVVGKAIADGLDPAVLTLVRFLLATLLFAPYVGRSHGLKLPSWRALRGYATISAALVAFFWCMFASLRYTSALNTSALFTLVPGISGIYGAVLLRERLSLARLLALVFGMVGALWIIFRGDLDLLLALAFNKGDLLFLAGCFAMAFYTPLVKLFYRREPMAVMTFWVLVTGSGWLLLLSAPRLAAVPWGEVAPMIWAGVVYLAVFSTIITFFLTHFVTPLLGSTRVMAYSYFYPAMVLVLDWLLGRGLPPLMTLPGVVIVLLATVVLQRGAVEPQTEAG
ncbi:DMT family transporter [Thermodesulfobacteriota bacterium]